MIKECHACRGMYQPARAEMSLNADTMPCMQRHAHNAHDFEAIYTFQDLDSPDARRILSIQDLISSPGEC